ncbi:vitamin K-dependent gamma-carboxylase-like [Tubulanus polymorphus]|uniref:vitamin K-dependent gamma-carboxylase-like n=1 Tax=Tubulanus polymorphus TaxID=672921 RepID=UPI003DA3C716
MGQQSRKREKTKESAVTIEPENGKDVDRFRKIFGFHWTDFYSFEAFTKWAHKPMQPYSLAVMRILFGVLMWMDFYGERRGLNLDLRWGDPENKCFFPLFWFLRPLPLQWMVIMYLFMYIATFGIMLGCFYRLSCAVFMVSYWYVFWLDKQSWNNHSYLYGLSSIILLIIDANRAWSIDGYIWPEIRNTHVPAWNYGLFRFQLFLVYFLASIKKLVPDWYMGYSMKRLAVHWVFSPFRLFMDTEMITLVVVHIGGLFIDMFIGYFLYFDITRPIGLMMGFSFNLMNAQIFSIGMFPYTMLATMPIFCAADWPVRFMRTWFPKKLQIKVAPLQINDHCIYEKSFVKPENQPDRSRNEKSGKKYPRSRMGKFHIIATSFLLCYGAVQLFLPFSHWISRGYNNWGEGLYGYSWNMMVQSWSEQHLHVKFVDKNTGYVGFLNPHAWTDSKQTRWNSYADMLKQYAYCVQDKLATRYNITNIELYVDVWKSVNSRIHQRMFNPTVDLISAEWDVFKQTKWTMPLQEQFNYMRAETKNIMKQLGERTNHTQVVTVIDFPGLVLENFIKKEVRNPIIQVLHGAVNLEIPMRVPGKNTVEKKNLTITPKLQFQLLPGLHKVYTISDTPSIYMYKFSNGTAIDLQRNLTIYKLKRAKAIKEGIDEATFSQTYPPEQVKLFKSLIARDSVSAPVPYNPLQTVAKVTAKIRHYVSGTYKFMLMCEAAFESVMKGERMESVLKRKNIASKTSHFLRTLMKIIP